MYQKIYVKGYTNFIGKSVYFHSASRYGKVQSIDLEIHNDEGGKLNIKITPDSEIYIQEEGFGKKFKFVFDKSTLETLLIKDFMERVE